MWQAKQIGWAVASVSGRSSAEICSHSTENPSPSNRAGLPPAGGISPIGRLHEAHALPAYQSTRMRRTRQPPGEASIWERHSWPQPAISGQREHAESRKRGVRATPLQAARRLSTVTPAGRWFSGHVITRSPRYFHQTATRRNATNAVSRSRIAKPIATGTGTKPTEQRAGQYA